MPSAREVWEMTVGDLAPGVKLSREVELSTHEERLEVSWSGGQVAMVSQEAVASGGPEYLAATVRAMVARLQDAALQGLGLAHRLEQIRDEAHARELRERNALLLDLVRAIRDAPNTDAAALLVLDEMEL